MSTKQYTVTHHPHGVTVETDGAGISANVLTRVLRAYDDHPVASYELARALDVVMVLTTEDGERKWLSELEGKQ
ncbi:MAG: hypothetical protein ACLFVJ_20545 [Persicimonas sp.]